MSIFENVMLPVLLIFLGGFIFQRVFKLDIKPLSTTAIYLLLPFLVFQTFYKEPLNSSFFYVVLTSSLLLIILLFIGLAVGRILGFSRTKVDGMLLSSCFPNSGNYGIPIVMFAFGEKGLLYGMPIMIFHNILMGIIGVYIAADHQGGLKAASKMVLKQPMNYVIIPAILMHEYQIKIPANFMKSIDLIGNATIPFIMLVLGMQLAEVSLRKVDWKAVGIAGLIRLIVSPLIAYLLCILMSISNPLAAIIIIMAAMPSAANTTLYAIQFQTEPDLVSTVTLTSTVTSILTLTILLNMVV